MDALIPDTDVIRAAVALASRAPSIHNSQPWRWHYDAGRLDLYADASRLLPAADPHGHQLLASCGAALDHLTVAATSLAWRTRVDVFPDATRPRWVASVRFGRDAVPTLHDLDLAAAIGHRRTDRTPFAAMPANPLLTDVLRAAGGDDAMVTVLDEQSRSALAEATERSTGLHHYDADYQSELHWWAGHSFASVGIPESALVPAAVREQVPVGRHFPAGHIATPSDPGSLDESTVLLLSTDGDTPADVVGSGRALSAVALEATVQGLATCTLSHLTEDDRSRDMLRALAPGTGFPQMLLRVGLATGPAPLTATPRRPLGDVLTLG